MFFSHFKIKLKKDRLKINDYQWEDDHLLNQFNWFYCYLYFYYLCYLLVTLWHNFISAGPGIYFHHSSSLLCLLSPQQEDCEKAYFKMDNVLIDDRRIHVDFSQSVSKIKWKGKGTRTEAFVFCMFWTGYANVDLVSIFSLTVVQTFSWLSLSVSQALPHLCLS